MANINTKRHIKIEAICDKPGCTELHTQTGQGGIFSVLGDDMPGGGYQSHVGFYGVHNQNEILNLMLSLMSATFQTAPEAMLDAMGHFMKLPGVAEAVMQRNMKARLQQKSKLEGVN